MGDFLEGTGYEPYSFKYMKVRLQDHFGDRILITEINGRSNVVTFRTTAAHILHEYCFDAKRGDEEAEKNRVTVTAAKLIKSEIKSLETNKQTYPSEADMESVGKGIEYLPATLKLFLQELFVGKDTDRKVASIGQAIMQCVRPRVIIAPLQIGLAVQMHRQFGSRFIVDSLNSHGFCSSYTEVQAYERSATVHQGTDISGFQSTSFMQHVADNVDHNLRTLDGFDTFHGMGIIAAVTPACRSTTAIPKVKVTSEDIAAVGKLDIRFYRRPCKESTALTYKALPAFVVDDDTYNADLLWKTAWLLHPHRQSWNGYMQTVHSGNHPGVSSIVFMPMIDMKSNDESCLYSTMHFVCAQSRRYGVTPILTFDQPLWWKSVEIQNAEASDSVLKKLVLRLGGLHTEMSFLGCIGHLMGGSGLHEVLETIYAESAVGHMLSGKAIARATRGHILVESVLTAMLLSKLYDSPLPGHESDSDRDSDPELVVDETDPQSVSETGRVQSGEIDPELMGDTGRDMVGDIDHEPLGETDAGPHDELGNDTGTAAGDHSDQVKADAVNRENGSAFEETTDTCVDVSDLEKAGYLFISLEKGDISLEDVRVNNLLTKLHDRLVQYKADLETYRTSKLWLQYLEMTELLRRFIKAERMGNWDLHLKTLSDMLPYFAASGHNLYTKSAYLYLQNMSTLEQDHPDVFQYFQNGYHVIRRTDRYWAGISTDLAIEQVLMRSVKTSGGLTRGRGMSEIQRAVWLLSTPACAEINRAMQEFTGVTYIASEQHKDSSLARIDRDHRDMLQLLQFLEPRSPFTEDDVLCSITNGVTADETVNVDQAQMVGTSVINALAGQEVHAFSFKKKDKAVTLLTKLSVKCDNEDVHVDPQLLFQRLVSSAARGTVSGDELEQLFTYELCTHPPALFTMDGLLREANKPPLADAIEHAVGHTPCEIPSPVKYVLDGGSLLYRIPWQRGFPYNGLCTMYIDHVLHKYGTGATVIFDGYTGEPSTKDTTHLRRSKGQIGKTVKFTGNMILNANKKTFLGNATNKQRFIEMLSEKMVARSITTKHAKGDADSLIVQTAVCDASESPVVVVGEDTDLLVLLCYHAKTQRSNIYLKSEIRQNKKNAGRVWDITSTKERLGAGVCHNILFLHAILGCDTTSRVFGLGKGLSLKRFQADSKFRKQAAVFYQKSATKQTIAAAGERALVSLYNGEDSETLDMLRQSRFFQKVGSSSKVVGPENIPPTSAAAKYHSFRVYHQVQEWQGRDDMQADEWGWIVKNGTMVGTQTDKPPAPGHLLNVIRCKCKTDCHTTRCSCKKHGLECSAMCGECKGVSCLNSPEVSLSIRDEDYLDT